MNIPFPSRTRTHTHSQPHPHPPTHTHRYVKILIYLLISVVYPIVLLSASPALGKDTADPEIFALNIFRLLIFRVVLFSSLELTDEIKPLEILFTHTRSAYTFLGPDTMSRHWREAGASDQRERGNAADTHAVSMGTAFGYLPGKISPICLGPRFQLPS